jgi:hypothetical protein
VENSGVVIRADVLGNLGRTGNYTLLFVYRREACDRVRKAIGDNLRLRAVPPGDFRPIRGPARGLDEFIALVTAVALVIGILGAPR